MVSMTNFSKLPPVISIDGPAGVGKGTVAEQLASGLGWHFLPSGILYRLLAWLMLKHSLTEGDLNELRLNKLLEEVGKHTYSDGEVWFNGQMIAAELRLEKCALLASQIAAIPAVRLVILAKQRAYRGWPGLVAEGRDMGTVVFQDAELKIFLTAPTLVRAERRHRQLTKAGYAVRLEDILLALQDRDERDANRMHSPLLPAEDAVVIDSSHQCVEEIVARLINLYHERG